MIEPFELTRLPRVIFGEASVGRLGETAASFGGKLLIVTGARSFTESKRWGDLESDLKRLDLHRETLQVDGEPSPDLVDEAVRRFRDTGIEVVVGIGGGSVLDAAKAVAGLLPHDNSVMDHLEGVGAGRPYNGPSLPMIAVPTTAGTGSEATSNAVLSARGDGGFKKSFRHEALTPQVAIVDPSLLDSCPAELVAADGMDALTQLLESYVSPRAGPVTAALAESGLRAVREGLLPWYEKTGDGREARARMACAALMSGITLAQAGLGSVHGLASPLGALFPIPHGVACGTLVGAATEVNIRAMRDREGDHPALGKYTRAWRILSGTERSGREARPDALPELLGEWTDRLRIPTLSDYGIHEDDIPRIVVASRGGSMRTNPVELSDDEIACILRWRL